MNESTGAEQAVAVRATAERDRDLALHALLSGKGDRG